MSRSSKFAIAAALGLVSFACDGAKAPSDAQAPAASPAALAGKVTLDGSSTIFPVAKKVVAAFRDPNPGVAVEVLESGSGNGFKRLCSGQIEIADASRPINAEEAAACKAGGVEFIEVPIGFDSLSVVVNAKNDFASCLTVAELRTIWEPGAEGKVKSWKQVRSSFPDRPLALVGPGKASGTFDYFTLAVVGVQHQSRTDYTSSEDDSVLVEAVAGNSDALGYFGFAYYAANKDRLKLVAVDGGKGCVAPSAEAVRDHTYQPLSRPLFVYVSKKAAARPEVLALARSFVAPENAKLVQDLGYLPLPPATLLRVGRRLDQGVTGSIFGEHGSVLGVTADVFDEDDRVKSALVQ